MGTESSPSLPFIPPQAATNAGPVDALFWYITLITIIFTVIVSVAVIGFAVKYRRGNKVNRANAPLENLPIEIAWTVIPLLICFTFFGWGAAIFFKNSRIPAGAMPIYVVGKQWMWKVQQPNGRWEMNEMHVPVGRDIRLKMTSEDVLHDFFIPAFRLKMDVIPGRYTEYWFHPTTPGEYHLYCAEYCGTYHSLMGGKVIVMEPAKYEEWLRTGNTKSSRAASGEKLFRQYGCSGCHGLNSSVKAPMLDGIYGKNRALEDGSFVTADDRYLRDSIFLPQKEIRAGFKPVMPTYKGRISESEVLEIIDYIKSLKTSNGTSNGSANPYGNGGVGPDNIAARTDVKTR